MKTQTTSRTFALAFAAWFAVESNNAEPLLLDEHQVKPTESIPLDQLGLVAEKQYQGEGMALAATPEGARLRCVFQRLEGEATPEGLWLTSSFTNTTSDRFRHGTGFLPLGAGVNNPVHALAMSGSNLYVGGSFWMAGGNPANDIARWDGKNWSPLGSGMNAYVSALAVSGANLYAGGPFKTAGGNPANFIAQWNGSSWSPLGSGMNTNVYALAVSGTDLYAGGGFTTAGGTPANHIAKWDGTGWSAVGSGVDSSVLALEASGANLYAGGDFMTAGGKVSPYIAGAKVADEPFSVFILTSNGGFGIANGGFGFDVSGPPGSTVVIEASTSLQNWIPLRTNSIVSGLLHFSDPQFRTNPLRFYRAVLWP